MKVLPRPESAALDRHRALGLALIAAQERTIPYLCCRGVPLQLAQNLVSDITIYYLERRDNPGLPQPVAAELVPWMRTATFRDWLDYKRRHGRREVELIPGRITAGDAWSRIESITDFLALGRSLYGDAWSEKKAILNMRLRGFSYEEIAAARREAGETRFTTESSVANEMAKIYATFRAATKSSPWSARVCDPDTPER